MSYRSSVARQTDELSSKSEVLLNIKVACSVLVAITFVESFMILFNRSTASTEQKLIAIRFGAYLFIPALMVSGWESRALGLRRLLPIVGTCATAFLFLTQFRGAWIWPGTFDQFMNPRTPWLVPFVLGAIAAALVGAVPAKSQESGLPWQIWLALLAVSVLASGVLPRLWPNDSEFVATRWIAMAATLIVLCVLALLAERSE